MSDRVMRGGITAESQPRQLIAQLLVVALLFSTLLADMGSQAGTAKTSRVALPDLFVLLLLAIALLRMVLYRRAGGFAGLSRILLPVYAIAVVSLIQIIRTSDEVVPYIVNLYVLLYFLVPALLLFVPAIPANGTVLARGTYVVIALFLISSLAGGPGAQGRWSSAGLFNNPNHAGAFAAGAMLVLLFTFDGDRVVRTALMVGCGMSMVQTMSFGATVGLGVGITVGLWSRARSNGQRAGLVLAVLGAGRLLQAAGTALKTLVPRLGTGALQRSGDTREQVWSSAWNSFVHHPLGVGLGHLQTQMGGKEVHNDFLAYAGAFGVIGVVLLVTVFVVLWRMGSSGLRSLVALTAILTTTHGAFSWRFLWVFMGIAFCCEAIVGVRHFVPTGVRAKPTAALEGGA